MSAIPEDVMRAAAEACHKFGVAPMVIPFVPSEACLVAMSAILAERQRCESIAREHVFDGHALAQATEFGRGCHQTATDIASAIRKEGEQG